MREQAGKRVQLHGVPLQGAVRCTVRGNDGMSAKKALSGLDTEQGNGINTRHKILYSCGYHITAAGERQEGNDTKRNYGIR